MAQVSPTKFRVEGDIRVGLVVSDVHKTAANYWNILGVGPWEIYDMRHPRLTNLTYHGKRAKFSMKAAVARGTLAGKGGAPPHAPQPFRRKG